MRAKFRCRVGVGNSTYSLRACVCVCVCVCEKEREREREREREKEVERLPIIGCLRKHQYFVIISLFHPILYDSFNLFLLWNRSQL